MTYFVLGVAAGVGLDQAYTRGWLKSGITWATEKFTVWRSKVKP